MAEIPSYPRDEAELKVTLTRLETKLDLVIGQHSLTLDDHERRLRVQEAKSYVTPKGLATTLVAVVTIMGGVIAFFDRLYPNI